MQSIRRPIKNTIPDNKRRWHDRFKRECTDRMKDARNNLINKNRENQLMQKILEEEWHRFKNENEQAMRNEGISDIDSLIRESLEEYEQEQTVLHLQYEQAELESEVEFYETSKNSVICVNCHKSNLAPTTKNSIPIAVCINCGFYATENCLNAILNSVNTHSLSCMDSILFSLEPGTDNTIVANCNTCELWDMFYM